MKQRASAFVAILQFVASKAAFGRGEAKLPCGAPFDNDMDSPYRLLVVTT